MDERYDLFTRECYLSVSLALQLKRTGMLMDPEEYEKAIDFQMFNLSQCELEDTYLKPESIAWYDVLYETIIPLPGLEEVIDIHHKHRPSERIILNMLSTFTAPHHMLTSRELWNLGAKHWMEAYPTEQNKKTAYKQFENELSNVVITNRHPLTQCKHKSRSPKTYSVREWMR
jgi:hypothetical protein